MLANIAPSMLEGTGIERPPSMMGRSLWAVWTGSTEVNRTTGALSQTQGSWALRAGSHKLIVKMPPKGERALLLYDVESDPEEREDLLARDGERADAMLEQLRTRLLDFGVSSPAGMLPECPDCEINAASAFLHGVMQDDPQNIELFRQRVREETEARLKALGYAED
jgi:arylsulfatase A-like enzyme